jgi:hypothetical protein
LSELRAQVRTRRRRWLAARALEAALIGGGAAAAALAAQRLSGPAPAAAAAAAAALCAVLAAAACLRERRLDERDYTRALDARVGAQGALVTACEAERRGDVDPLAALLGARTAEGLARSRWHGAAQPPSPLAAAALLGGLALLAAVGRPAPAAPWSAVEALLGELEGRAAAGSLSGGELERALEHLEGALDAARPAPALRREAERRHEDLLVRLERRAGDPGGAGAGAASAGDGSSGGGAGGQSGSSQAPLAAGGGDRTMSRPDPGGTMRPQSSQAPADLDRADPVAAPTWPRRHDAVVAGYLERRPRD